MSLRMKKNGVPTRSAIHWPVQSQKQVRSLKFWCSENKGADQLCSYCTADLRLCFRICRLLAFWCDCSIIIVRKTCFR